MRSTVFYIIMFLYIMTMLSIPAQVGVVSPFNQCVVIWPTIGQVCPGESGVDLIVTFAEWLGVPVFSLRGG